VHEVEGERAADGEGEHASDDEEHFADEAAPHRLIPEISGPLGSLCAQKEHPFKMYRTAISSSLLF
jgi:hypothetical protein